VRRCEGQNDKVKYCVLLCGDDGDPDVVKAAAGALAMLTQV
jgi:phosphoketolase